MKTMTAEEIGHRLACLRRLRGLSQLELATAIGVGREVVVRTESGGREMAFHEALGYAQVLCFCLNAFGRTGADGRWNIGDCLLPYPPQPA